MIGRLLNGLLLPRQIRSSEAGVGVRTQPHDSAMCVLPYQATDRRMGSPKPSCAGRWMVWNALVAMFMCYVTLCKLSVTKADHRCRQTCCLGHHEEMQIFGLGVVGVKPVY